MKADGETTIKSPSVVNGENNGKVDGGEEENDSDMANFGEAAESGEAAGGAIKLTAGGGFMGVMALMVAALIL